MAEQVLPKGRWARELSRSSQAELKRLAMGLNWKELKGGQEVTSGFWERRREEGQSASLAMWAKDQERARRGKPSNRRLKKGTVLAAKSKEQEGEMGRQTDRGRERGEKPSDRGLRSQKCL